MANLQQLLSTLQAASGNIESVKSQVSEAQSTQISAMQDQLNLLGQIGANQQIITRQQEVGGLQAQQNTRRGATALGTNMSDNGELMTALGRLMRDSAATVLEQGRKVAQLQEGVASWNPLAIVRDIFTGDQERAKLSAAQQTLDQASTAFQQLNQATQTLAVTQNAIQETKTEATVAAQTSIVRQQAEGQEAQMREKLATTNIDGLLRLQGLNAQQVQLASQAYNASVQATQMAWAREQRELDRQLRLDKIADEQALLEVYNSGAATLGLPQLDNASLRRLIQVDKDAVARVYRIGSSIQTTGVAKLSDDPLEALAIVQNTGASLNPAQQEMLRKVGNDISTTPVDQMVDLLYPTMPVQERMQLKQNSKRHNEIRSQYIKAKAAGYAQTINPDDGTNWYQLGTLNTLSGERYLQENSFLRDNIAPLVDTNDPVKFDPSMLMKLALEEGIKKGRYQTEEIVDAITWTANKLKLQANLTSNYQGFGLPVLNQINMPVSLSLGGYAKFSDTIDLSDPVAVRRAVATLVGEQARNEGFASRIVQGAAAAGYRPSGGVFWEWEDRTIKSSNN